MWNYYEPEQFKAKVYYVNNTALPKYIVFILIINLINMKVMSLDEPGLKHSFSKHSVKICIYINPK